MILLSYIYSRRMRPLILAALLIAAIVFAIEGRSDVLVFAVFAVLGVLCAIEAWRGLMQRSDELTREREKVP
jgi:hypothetical protein